jgi:hypothetical protein
MQILRLKFNAQSSETATLLTLRSVPGWRVQTVVFSAARFDTLLAVRDDLVHPNVSPLPTSRNSLQFLDVRSEDGGRSRYDVVLKKT